MSKLYILGNGFDLYHGLPTSYKDYKSYLELYCKDIYSAYAGFKYLNLDYALTCNDERWSRIEEAINIDYTRLLKDFLKEASSESPQDYLGSEDACFLLDEATRFIFDFTGECFARWVRSIDVSTASPILNLTSSDFYISFNYTSSLEHIYSIEPSNILHVHGSIDSVDPGQLILVDCEIAYPAYIPDDLDIPEVVFCKDEPNNIYIKSVLQFGNPLTSPGEVEERLRKSFGRGTLRDPVISKCIDKAVTSSKAAYKDLAHNYDAISAFLAGKDIDTVVVFGHSYDGVDRPYYEDIFAPKLHRCDWVFWPKDPSFEKVRIDCFCDEVCLPAYRIMSVGSIERG